METTNKKALLNEMAFARQILMWAKNNGTEVGVSFIKRYQEKLIDPEEINGSRKFLVNDVTETSFLLMSEGKIYPRDGSRFLMKDIASMTEHFQKE